MTTVNKQILLGRLTADAEGRSMPNSSDMVANLRLVTYDRFVDRKNNNEPREIAEYHRVAVFGRLAEEARNLKEGTEVYVEGRSRTRKYQQQGQDRYITELVASVLFATGQSGNASADNAQAARPASAAPARVATPAPASNTPDRAWDDDGSEERPF